MYVQAPINGVAPIEREASVRENVALSIGIIVQDEAGRQVLFDIGAPEIVKKGYEFEENSDVMQAMECIGEILQYLCSIPLYLNAESCSACGSVQTGLVFAWLCVPFWLPAVFPFLHFAFLLRVCL